MNRLAAGLLCGLVTGLACVQGAIGDTARPAGGCKDLTVFVAGRFHTMNPGRPLAGAVAVCDGRIVGLGDTVDDLEPWTRRTDATIDRRLAGKTVFPGFIDAHQHPLMGAITANLPGIAALDTAQPYGPDIPGVANASEAFDRLRQYESRLEDPAAPLLAWGWDVPVMGRHLTRDDLDAISRTRPVVVWDASEHHAYTNSVALRQLGPLPPDLPGVGRDASGEPNGQFLGVQAASRVITPLLARELQPARAQHLMRWLIDLNRRHGITTTTDHSLGIFDLDTEVALLDGLFNDPRTPQRLLAIPAAHGLLERHASPAQAIEALHALQARSTDRLMYRGVKFFTDDSFNGLTFQPGAGGYTDGHEGLWVTPPAGLAALMLPWWQDGQQLFVHAIGAAAQEATLGALRQLHTRLPRVDHRFTVEHLGMARHDQVRALHALGALANVNVYYLWLRGEAYPDLIGRDRAEDLAPLGSLVNEDIPVALHSDYPIAPPRPLLAATIAVTRTGLSGSRTLGAAQAVGLHDALRMITVDAAYVLGIDDRVGSIEPGKLADFTVLERDPYEVDPGAIKDIRVWGTVLGGRVFEAAGIRAP